MRAHRESSCTRTRDCPLMRAGFALLPHGHFRVTREPLAGEPRVCMNLHVSGTVGSHCPGFYRLFLEMSTHQWRNYGRARGHLPPAFVEPEAYNKQGVPVAEIVDPRPVFYIAPLPTHPLRHNVSYNDIHNAS